jgi:hypothetical protein
MRVFDTQWRASKDAAEALFLLLTTGLDPVVNANLRLIMDCRIKSGNDEF